VLAYHNIVNDRSLSVGDVSLHLPLTQLESHLEMMKQEADLVDLGTLLEAHGLPGRRVAVTFDDAYWGALNLGVPACLRAGCTPTVFIACGLLGRFPEWDVLADAGRWSAEERRRFLEERRGLQPGEPVSIGRLVDPDHRIATPEEVRVAFRESAFFPGNHTFRHANLGSLDDEEVRTEIELGAQSLMALVQGHPVPWLAYPYGIAPRNLSVVASSGVPVAFRVDGGWSNASTRPDRHAWPRWNVPSGLSAEGFRARLRGWLCR
jgi:peptidoglycan/xylan/chitin deacetylase (PgdA/CDA1 family)